jgi:hypothetical protein
MYFQETALRDKHSQEVAALKQEVEELKKLTHTL